MTEPPSLIFLAIQAIKHQLLDGDDSLQLSDLYELPSHLFDSLVTQLPPLALHKLQIEMPYENSDGYDECSSKTGKKRGRSCIFDTEWKNLFRSRWSLIVDNIDTDDWHQKYWETHLQNCLDEAAGSSMVSFDGCVGEIIVPEYVLKCIGCEGHLSHSSYSKLSHHFQQFGHYARCLRLQSVLCIGETCQLLRNCRLQSLTLRWIRSEEHVDGLCKLLVQNSETLTSLEFIHCKLSSTSIDAICRSLEIKNRQTHGIQNLSIRTSVFLEANLMSLPPSLVSFLSSGRSLCSLRFSGNHLDRNFARILFTLLFDASSSVSILDLSDNTIAGWLSSFNRGSSSRAPLSLEMSNCLQSLRVLQLRCLIPYFAEAMERCSPLVELNLENCDLSCEGVTLLLDTLSTLQKQLKSLTLADNGLGSPVAGALRKYLGTSIRELNIGGIGLGKAGFKELHKGLMGELSIVKINISKNCGGLETVYFLTKLMSLAPDLVDVNASYNLMPAESSTLICSALKAAKGKLQRLDLTGNSWYFQQNHTSLLAEFQHNGRPVVILPSFLAPNIPYDDDP
ncbi:uncharacterized protein LOC126656254 isoform X2 [Mercurialis annua]|uniref:uncharacterized protein LOC126656254 isoform X2 n=1 Tax=Mercurialis annua TaxID=3986 RepID=UPI002160037D|nr:uncharacterized protein LOC126656254 isoform X2 [Mercurialis annua]